MPFDKQTFTATYGGIAIRYQQEELAYSIVHLLEYLLGWIKMIENDSQSDPLLKQETDQHVNAIKSGQAVTPIGGIKQWYTIASQLKQKKRDDKTTPVDSYLLNIAGRRVILRSPSDRYAYDYGSFQDYSLEIGAPATTLPAYHAGQTPQTDAIKPSAYLGYRDICANMRDSDFDNLTMAQAMRNILMGRLPASNAVLQQTNANAAKAVNDIRTALSAFQQGVMDNDALAKTITDILKNVPDITDLQPNASAALTITMKQRLDGINETEYFNTLSVLTASWFIAEFSRNHVAFAVGKMLLDLIQIEATLSVDEMPITFRTAICHPDMPLTGAIKDVDPERKLCKLGGLHPMSHLGSFTEDFGNNPDKLEKDNLSWSHIKSGAIICEWLLRALTEQNIDCRIVNQAELARINALPATESYDQADKAVFNHIRQLIIRLLTDPAHQCILKSELSTRIIDIDFPVVDAAGNTYKLKIRPDGICSKEKDDTPSAAKFTC